MVNPGTLIGGAGLLLSLSERRERKQLDEQVKQTEADVEQLDAPLEVRKQDEIASGQDRTADAVERLVEIEERNQAGPEDKDAFSSVVIDLNPGETAEVEVEPAEGFNLRVKRVYFDRKTDHSYSLNVGGDVTSVSHRAIYTKPKLVSQSDRVVAEVTNNSATTTTVDFELEAWAERP